MSRVLTMPPERGVYLAGARVPVRFPTAKGLWGA
jgi:hypothetical protein